MHHDTPPDTPSIAHLPWQFLQFARRHQVLRLGQFTLKSGRQSNFFFDLGRVRHGAALSLLAEFYALRLLERGLVCDSLFGSAYKGIVLVAALAMRLAEHHGCDLPYCYNRKESKDHGEGGVLVGMPMGKVVIVDDVLTAGTATRQVVPLLRQAGAEPVALLVGLDREEPGPGGQGAALELQRDLGIEVLAIAKKGELERFLEQEAPEDYARLFRGGQAP
jgi:orotate phosphoribosyltransferase